MPKTYIAIEIDSETTWEILTTLDPTMAQLDYEFNRGFFVVLNHENVRVSIMSPTTVGRYFDHIETSDKRVKLVQLIK